MKQLIVTGAGGDLGAAIATLASARGYRVGVLDISMDMVTPVADRLDNAVALEADITDQQAVEAAFAAFGEVPDVLVNNAGLVRFGPLVEQSVQDFQDVVNVNLVGTYIVSRTAANLMLPNGGGAIVNITSMGGIHPA
ncbi:MAG: SDR family NAD(P)-dependent oxidoreductase, partial [Alphaproteobacteria bacterium]